eukprot:766245-Hanusia_phi.AAC.1
MPPGPRGSDGARTRTVTVGSPISLARRVIGSSREYGPISPAWPSEVSPPGTPGQTVTTDAGPRSADARARPGRIIRSDRVAPGTRGTGRVTIS